MIIADDGCSHAEHVGREERTMFSTLSLARSMKKPVRLVAQALRARRPGATASCRGGRDVLNSDLMRPDDLALEGGEHLLAEHVDGCRLVHTVGGPELE